MYQRYVQIDLQFFFLPFFSQDNFLTPIFFLSSRLQQFWQLDLVGVGVTGGRKGLLGIRLDSNNK